MKIEKLVHKIDNFGINLWGNRVFATGLGLIAFRMYQAFSGNPELVPLAWVGGGMIGGTHCGRTTPEFYNRTRKHIEKNNGELDERFVETLINGTENRALFGYCQQQGCYLAARDYDQLDIFEKAREKYSNVMIPHF